MEWMADHVTRRPPLLTAGNAVVLYKDMTCSIRKAAEHLGFAPGPWRAALTQAVAWFRENGYFERALN
jgi:dihydroflavonol-4-reductase